MIWDRLKPAIAAFHTILALQWNLPQITPHPAMWLDMQKIDWLVLGGMLHMWHATSLHKCSKWNKILSGGEIKLCVKTHRSYKSLTLPKAKTRETSKSLQMVWTQNIQAENKWFNLSQQRTSHFEMNWRDGISVTVFRGITVQVTDLECLRQLLCNRNCHMSGCQSFPCIHKINREDQGF